MNRFLNIRLATLIALSGAHILACAQQAPVPSVSGKPVPELQKQVKLTIAKGTILGYVSWTSEQEKDSTPSKNLHITSQREVPKIIFDNGTKKVVSHWVDAGTVTVKNLTKKKDRYTRHFTVTGLPSSTHITITARTADGQYSAQQEVTLAPDRGRTLSLKLE